MRRNGRGGGGQSWMQRPAASRVAGGPLMTDHIGLQDIDKELELLKRKREIIEQQQQILSSGFRRNDYQQPSYGHNTSRFDDYAQLYDDMRDRDGPSRKRPIAVWEDEIPFKRFSGPTRPSRPRGSLAPRLPSLLETPMRRPPPTRRPLPKIDRKKEIPLAKVTKPSSQANVANKLDSYPVAQRKKLVAETENLTRKEPEPVKGELHLLADVLPSKQVTGRLELALGSIIKDIKATDKQDDLKVSSVMRGVKSVIRERIREMMVGKVVGSGELVKAKYREVYDLQSDLDVVTDAICAHKGEINLVCIDDPETYFKNNMYRLMQMRLKNMLEKLEKIYIQENPNYNQLAGDKKKGESNSPLQPLDDKFTSTEQFKRLEKTMATKMTFMLKKFMPYLTKIMDIDSKYARLKKTIMNETVKMLKEKEGQTADVNLNESADLSVASVEDASPNDDSVEKAREPYKPLPYFCKLLGKPTLPKRKQMELFFNEFNPRSIKKHRNMHNLLFIGFNEKDSFDRMLAADGTVIGKYTLSIRVSERAVEAPKNEELNNSQDVIGADLDTQITDLLSSIRQAENTEGVLSDVAENAVENGNADISGTAVGNEEGQIDDESGVADPNKTIEIIEETGGIVNSESVENADGIETSENNEIETDNTDIDATICNDIEIAEGDHSAKADAIIADNTKNSETDNEGADVSTDAKKDDKANEIEEAEKVDIVQPMVEVKPVAKGTPARASARLAATPSRIQTRRSSKLAQND